MANVKNFGLIGVGTNVQYGKGGARIIESSETFSFKNAVNSANVAITAAGITSSAGNVTLTTGNVVMSDTAGTMSIGGDTTLSRHAAGIFQLNGDKAVVMPSGATGVQPSAAATAGGMRYNTTVSQMEYSNGATWVTLATGGATVSSFQTSLSGLTPSTSTTGAVTLAGTLGGASGGTGVNNGTDTITTAGNVNFGGTVTTVGNFSTAGAFSTAGGDAVVLNTTGATSVTLPTSGTLLTTADTTNYVSSFSAGTTGFTPNSATTGAVALAGTLNPTHGGTGVATFSSGDVLYASAANVWSAGAKGTVSGVQAWDAALDALAAKTSTGILVQTAANTYSSVSLVAPAAGITISDPDGVAGAPTFALADDLAQVEGLTGVGYTVRQTGGTWTTRTITGTSGQIAVSNGNGDTSNTDIGLAAVIQGAGSSFVKVSLDGFGRVTGNTAVVAADIETLVDGTYVNVSGDTMNSNADLTFVGGGEVLGLPVVPSNATAATSKAYVDNLVTAGTLWRNPIVDPNLLGTKAATGFESALFATMTVGQSVTYIATAAFTFAGQGGGTSYVASINDVVTLQKTSATVGNWSLIKPLEAADRFLIGGENGTIDSAFYALNFRQNALIQYVSGVANAYASWTQPSDAWYQVVNFSVPKAGGDSTGLAGATTYTASVSVNGTPHAISILGSTAATFATLITEINADIGTWANAILEPEGHIHIYALTSGQPVIISDTDLFSTLTDFSGILAGVENGTTVLNNAPLSKHFGNTYLYSHTLNAWTEIAGPGAVQAGIGLYYSGNVLNVGLGAGIKQLPGDEVGIDIATGVAVQLTGTGTATGDQLTLVLDGGGITSGLAQSASGLKIAATGVTNAMLANSTININTDSGSDPVALGETLLIAGTAAQGINTVSTANTVTITASDATTSQKGVAKFTATEFDMSTPGTVALGLVGPTKGGTGFASYTVGDILYADTTTSLAKRAVGAAGTVLKGGTTPTYGAVSLTADVSGILPAANGGTGVSNSNTITAGGNVNFGGAFTTTPANDVTFTTTGATSVTLPTSGTLATTAGTVASFSAGTTGFTPNSATTGAVTLAGTLATTNGGTGLTAFVANEVFYAGSTSTMSQSANFLFDGTSTMTIGGAKPLAFNGATGTISATATNSDITITPNGTGAVIIGPVGAGLIQSDPSNPLTVRGNTTLTLTSVTGSTTMVLPTGTGSKVSVSGPTAADYATSLANNDLVNKYYVDSIAGSATGDIKAFKQVVALDADGTTPIGTVLPTGATILSVKVSVTTADTGAILSVGISGTPAAYMATTENDPQTIGLYLAECMVVNLAVQIIATVATSGNTASSSATVVVTYQLA